ncbi:unnamed protein product, partial [Mesorhabditis spiculigera]
MEDTWRVTTTVNAAYLASAFGDRLWMFTVGILMADIGGMSWVAIQQLVDSLAKLALLPSVGALLDKMNRNRAIQILLLVNNVCIFVSASAFFAGETETAREHRLVRHVCLCLALLFGAISRVTSEAQKITFTKDWIVVLTEASEGKIRLSTQNTIMVVCDHVANVIAPISAGFLIDHNSLKVVCLFNIIWNMLSWILEGGVLYWVYQKTGLLHTKNGGKFEVDERPVCGVAAFRAYYRQSCLKAALGLAFLYMTVLGFDNLAVSYGVHQGVSATNLAFLRASGAVLGILGTFSYGGMAPWIGVLWTALIGLFLQNIAISVSGASTFLPGNAFNASGYISDLSVETFGDTILQGISSGGTMQNVDKATTLPFFQLPLSIILFFTGITAARFGLWIADPAITQIMQETIPERERYTVFGVQTAICELFSVIKDMLVILFPTVQMFGALSLLSCGFVFTGFLLYISHFLTNIVQTKKKREPSIAMVQPAAESVPLASIEELE